MRSMLLHSGGETLKKSFFRWVQLLDWLIANFPIKVCYTEWCSDWLLYEMLELYWCSNRVLIFANLLLLLCFHLSNSVFRRDPLFCSVLWLLLRLCRVKITVCTLSVSKQLLSNCGLDIIQVSTCANQLEQSNLLLQSTFHIFFFFQLDPKKFNLFNVLNFFEKWDLF